MHLDDDVARRQTLVGLRDLAAAAKARGLAIDTAAESPEEFPAFTQFWLERDAGGLTALGVRPGDRVVVTMANCPELAVIYNALWRAGEMQS